MTDDTSEEVILLGLQLIVEMIKRITVIRQRLQDAQNRQKYYEVWGKRSHEVSGIVFTKVTAC